MAAFFWSEANDRTSRPRIVDGSGADRICSFEKKAGASKAGFGFLEFGDVERRNVKAKSLDACACARERSRENNGAGEGQGIGSMRLFRIHVDPFEPCKWFRVEPGTIGEQESKSGSRTRRLLPANVSNRRFQMKAAGDGNGDDFIVVRRKNGAELANAFGVAAPRKADEELSTDAEDIPAFERAGKKYVFELSKLGESVSERLSFATPSSRSERQDHRQFIEHDGRIFNKHGVGKSRLGGKRNNAGAQFTEQLLVSVVLFLGYG